MSERDGAAAIQHGYAATIYQAQGATADRAFVLADASMDRQEFYVATSRSREETYIYATPEVRLDREEIAPAEPGRAEGIEHIARAAERDGAQVAAHEQALRSRFSGLGSEELYRLRAELRSEAGAERKSEWDRRNLDSRIGMAEGQARSAAREIEQVRKLPRRERAAARVRAEEAQDRIAGVLRKHESERAELPEPGHDSRAELAVVEHLIAGRERARLAAAILAPPDYLVEELGERPEDLLGRHRWEQAASRIESYRTEHGIRDPENALGPEPKDPLEHDSHQDERRRLRESRRELGLELDDAHKHSIERDIDLGIGL